MIIEDQERRLGSGRRRLTKKQRAASEERSLKQFASSIDKLSAALVECKAAPGDGMAQAVTVVAAVTEMANRVLEQLVEATKALSKERGQRSWRFDVQRDERGVLVGATAEEV